MKTSIIFAKKFYKNYFKIRFYSTINYQNLSHNDKNIVLGVENFKYVPKCQPVATSDLERLNEFVYKSKRLFILSGAGLSTESGIPDYRSEGVGLYATSKNRPMNYSDFLKSEKLRSRYWARNYVGNF